MEEARRPGLMLSVVIILSMSATLATGLLAGISTVSLLAVNIVLVSAISMLAGYPYRRLEEGMISGIKSAVVCVVILMLVGMLIAAWILSGTVPMVIYYGLQFVTPSLLLVMTFVICSLLSLFTGSSWGTAGTLGVACVAMGSGMGVPIALTAGAAISGAILGDKLSPLSDSTILASSMSQIDIYDHIRSMAYTTTPAVLLTVIAYFFAGRSYENMEAGGNSIAVVSQALSSQYNFNIVLLLPFVVIIVLSVKKFPSLLTIVVSAMTGLILAIVIQGERPGSVIAAIQTGVKIDTGVDLVDQMLNKGGISSMMSTVSILLLALGLGGILNEVGYLKTIVDVLTVRVKTPRAIVLTTLLCGMVTICVIVNFHVSVVLVSSMFRDLYDRNGIHRSVLSRTIEEANTMMLPVIPWNASCIYYMGLFGLNAPVFAPYTFMVWANILVSLIFIVNRLCIFRADPLTKEPIWSVRRTEVKL